MKRNRLSRKKVEMNSAAGKANTSNPFIMLDFYEQLSEIRSIILNIFSYQTITFPSNDYFSSGEDTEITKKEIKKADISQHLSLP